MSIARPLRLKTETARRVEKVAAESSPIAKVWVDNGVAHLDGLFDYLVPARLDSEVRIGVRISVDFAGRECEALVVERSEGTTTGLKFISKVLAPTIVAPQGLLDLITASCARWIAHPYDFLRSAIPPRAVGIDKLHRSVSPEIKPGFPFKSTKTYIHVQPHEDAISKLAEFALTKVKTGSILIITPEERELELLAQALGENVCILSGSLTRSVRYQNYLRSITESNLITIGTRSAIFSFPPDLQTIVIFREGAESHYEPRSPGWNTRDVALIRSETSGCDLFFVGYSPSLETALIAEQNQMKMLGKRIRLKVSNFESINGELLPNRIFPPIRNALKSGPVLFLIPRKGYASSLMCKKCRNIVSCECGGKVTRRKSGIDPDCSICGKIHHSLKCRWCESDALIMLGRGGERHTEEIGRAFSNFPTYYSTADSQILNLPNSPALVIATSGMEPRVEGGYSAVVLLEGDSFFSFSDSRAQERARETFFIAAACVSADGLVITVVNSTNPISSALAQWNPKVLARRELAERSELNLPPFSRSIVMEVESAEATSIVAGFKKALLDLRLPASSRVLGPAQSNDNKSKILLTADKSDSDQLLKFVGDYIRHRAVTKKKTLSVRVDPYSLT